MEGEEKRARFQRSYTIGFEDKERGHMLKDAGSPWVLEKTCRRWLQIPEPPEEPVSVSVSVLVLVSVSVSARN